MKKLKCTSCGANLKIDENDKNFAHCEYCGAKYKLNEELKIDIKLDDDIKESLKMGQEMFKKVNPIRGFITFVVIAIILLTVSAFIGMKVIDHNEKKVTQEETKDTVNDPIDEASKWIEKKSFNNKFELYVGTISDVRVKWLLDDVSTNNKTNDIKVMVKYRETITSNPEDMINIKRSLDAKDYEVILDYNEDGYVNQISIEKVG